MRQLEFAILLRFYSFPTHDCQKTKRRVSDRSSTTLLKYFRTDITVDFLILRCTQVPASSQFNMDEYAALGISYDSAISQKYYTSKYQLSTPVFFLNAQTMVILYILYCSMKISNKFYSMVLINSRQKKTRGKYLLPVELEPTSPYFSGRCLILLNFKRQQPNIIRGIFV